MIFHIYKTLVLMKNYIKNNSREYSTQHHSKRMVIDGPHDNDSGWIGRCYVGSGALIWTAVRAISVFGLAGLLVSLFFVVFAESTVHAQSDAFDDIFDLVPLPGDPEPESTTPDVTSEVESPEEQTDPSGSSSMVPLGGAPLDGLTEEAPNPQLEREGGLGAEVTLQEDPLEEGASSESVEHSSPSSILREPSGSPGSLRRVPYNSVVLEEGLGPITYHRLVLQLGTWRVSAQGAHEFWGAAGQHVNILGTGGYAESDYRGQAHIEGVPQDSELLLYITDPAGQYVPVIHEVAIPTVTVPPTAALPGGGESGSTSEQSLEEDASANTGFQESQNTTATSQESDPQKVEPNLADFTRTYGIRRTLIHKEQFHQWLFVAGQVDEPGMGHICGDIHPSVRGSQASSSTDSQKPSLGGGVVPLGGDHSLAGYQVQVGHTHGGVFYFNEFGHIDPHLTQTSKLGRFCVFNVAPGAVVVDLQHQGTLSTLTQFAHSTPRGLTSITFQSVNQRAAALRYIVSPSASDFQARAPLPHPLPPRAQRPPPLVVLEQDSQEPTHSTQMPRAQQFRPRVSTWEGYIHVTVQEERWEPALFRLPAWFWQGGSGLLSLLPRGKIGEIARNTGHYYNPSAGNIWVQHGLRAQSSEGKLSYELWDLDGQSYDAAFSRTSEGLLRVGYLNLEKGRYLWVLKNAAGHWLSTKVVAVVPGVVSMVYSGRRLVYAEDQWPEDSAS